MNFLDAILLGLVEGVTEFLPVSSTGHLILVKNILSTESGRFSGDFITSFTIAIQLGAILAVLVWYGRSLFRNRKVIARVGAAFIPAAITGLIMYKIIKNILLDSSIIVIWALVLGGILLIAFEMWYEKKQSPGRTLDVDKISYGQAVTIGVWQAIAIIPGVSRSAATIIGGMISGLSRHAAVEFSFLLAVPTLAAATGLDFMQNASSFTQDNFTLLGVGFVTSFITALASIALLLRFVRTHTFIPFGFYRILIAVTFWMFIIL